jgi:hypothetical protein
VGKDDAHGKEPESTTLEIAAGLLAGSVEWGRVEQKYDRKEEPRD